MFKGTTLYVFEILLCKEPGTRCSSIDPVFMSWYKDQWVQDSEADFS